MNVALNVALQQQHDRYAAQVGGGFVGGAPIHKDLYAGIYDKQLLTKEGSMIIGTKEAWKQYFKYAKLVKVPSNIKGAVKLDG